MGSDTQSFFDNAEKLKDCLLKIKLIILKESTEQNQVYSLLHITFQKIARFVF